MATGALIRDFVKDSRELRYSNSGSIGLSEIEHNAYRASLTLEITHVDAPRYGSRKTLPDNTHYGYATLFRGSTVTDTFAIKYPKFRIFDIRNQGIWNYHQSIESVLLGGEQTRGILELVVDGFVPGVFSDAASWLSDSALSWAYDAVSDAWRLIFGGSAGSGGGVPGGSGVPGGYRAFPIATPFPDIAKFKADIPCSFLWRLELWYLVNPAVYIADNPTDTGDVTDGEDEYPNPEQGDGDGDGDEFPAPDEPDPDRDSRDYSGGTFDPNQGFVFQVDMVADPGFCSAGRTFRRGPFGPFRGFGRPISVEKGPTVPNCPAAGFGFFVRFENGQRLGPFEPAAGVYSGSIVNVSVVN